jgi:hypothetical protein
LKATHANNYDILYEQYLKPLGLFTAGVFYKSIDDPIVVLQTEGVHYPGYTQSFILASSGEFVGDWSVQRGG